MLVRRGEFNKGTNKVQLIQELKGYPVGIRCQLFKRFGIDLSMAGATITRKFSSKEIYNIWKESHYYKKAE